MCISTFAPAAFAAETYWSASERAAGLRIASQRMKYRARFTPSAW